MRASTLFLFLLVSLTASKGGADEGRPRTRLLPIAQMYRVNGELMNHSSPPCRAIPPACASHENAYMGGFEAGLSGEKTVRTQYPELVPGGDLNLLRESPNGCEGHEGEALRCCQTGFRHSVPVVVKMLQTQRAFASQGCQPSSQGQIGRVQQHLGLTITSTASTQNQCDQYRQELRKPEACSAAFRRGSEVAQEICNLAQLSNPNDCRSERERIEQIRRPRDHLGCYQMGLELQLSQCESNPYSDRIGSLYRQSGIRLEPSERGLLRIRSENDDRSDAQILLNPSVSRGRGAGRAR